MNINDLKVGDKVFIREDLIHLQEYGNAVYYKSKGSGERTIAWFYNDNKKDTFVTAEDNCYYTSAMIDWEKTIKLRREKMKINDLKVGDVVYIRDDVNKLEKWANKYDEPRLTGVQQIFKVDYNNERFKIIGELDMALIIRNSYTVEMVDWEKTRDLKINESWENIKRAISGGSTFKEISQSGESGNEITKATMYDGREITVKNNNEENDIEKAVMLLMLKSVGITYGDVKKEVEKVKVKWMPKKGEKYYWINPYFEINWRIWQELRLDRKLLESGDCFKTEEDAEEKLEKIKEVLRGE